MGWSWSVWKLKSCSHPRSAEGYLAGSTCAPTPSLPKVETFPVPDPPGRCRKRETGSCGALCFPSPFLSVTPGASGGIFTLSRGVAGPGGALRFRVKGGAEKCRSVQVCSPWGAPEHSLSTSCLLSQGEKQWQSPCSFHSHSWRFSVQLFPKM